MKRKVGRPKKDRTVLICPKCKYYYLMTEVFSINELSMGNTSKDIICENCGEKLHIDYIPTFNVYARGKDRLKNETVIPLD